MTVDSEAIPALEEERQRQSLARRMRNLLVVVIAVVPFFSRYYYHFQSPKGPTGFIQSDWPQFSAYGREVFERGNGFAYPNAYDPDPDAPVIYFHWLIWLLGVGIVKFGADPGYLSLGVSIAGAFLFGWLTLRLIDEILQKRDFRISLYLVAMWGGGLFCVLRVAENLQAGQWWRDQLMYHDPTGWYKNWGRSASAGFEPVYHFLVAICWIAVFRRWWKTALLAAFLLATTHPWSGLQLTGALSLWFTIQLVRQRTPAAFGYWLASAATSIGFLGYNLVYLNRFPQHRAIHDILSLPHIMSNRDILLAYAPVAAVAALRLWIDRSRLTHKDGFLLCMFGVSFALATHDRFLPIKPIEPLHFTRGYVWMTLFLLGLPLVQRVLVALRERFSAAAVAVAFAPLFLLAVFDNLCLNVLMHETERAGRVSRGRFLSNDERNMLEWIDEQRLDGILFSTDESLGYLSASYTSLRPWLGHHFMTPDVFRRREQIADWLAGEGEHPWFAQVDYVLRTRDEPLPLLDRGQWQSLYENESLILLERDSHETGHPGRSPQ